ncbi:MAG: IclR family transcriptional regulator [Caldilineaceae bacterium]|nr:IclR family transcriptional regulator [Caldilineaceae bacterium]
MSSDYIVKPVHKALQVLLCLGEDGQPQTLTEICYKVRLPKTTVFRYLQTLHASGFVGHDADSDTYRLGLRLFELGQLAGDQLRVRDVAWPYLQSLRDQFNETINLGMLDNMEIVYIDMAESRHSLRMQARLGSRDPVYSTALGKAILAFTPQERWPQHIPERFEPRTAQTQISRNALYDELLNSRARGYALDNGENEEGTLCIGAPIFDHSGHVRYALSLSAPASRIDESTLPAVTAAIVDVAATVSQRLGYRGVDDFRLTIDD